MEDKELNKRIEVLRELVNRDAKTILMKASMDIEEMLKIHFDVFCKIMEARIDAS